MYIDDSLDGSSKVLTDALLKGMKEKSSEYSLGRISQFTFEEITKKMEGTAEIDRIETGFDVLDKYTNGGFANEEYVIIGERIAISRMTFSHQMIRLLVVEQIYRAFTILKGEPYHNE